MLTSPDSLLTSSIEDRTRGGLSHSPRQCNFFRTSIEAFNRTRIGFYILSLILIIWAVHLLLSILKFVACHVTSGDGAAGSNLPGQLALRHQGTVLVSTGLMHHCMLRLRNSLGSLLLLSLCATLALLVPLLVPVAVLLGVVPAFVGGVLTVVLLLGSTVLMVLLNCFCVPMLATTHGSLFKSMACSIALLKTSLFKSLTFFMAVTAVVSRTVLFAGILVCLGMMLTTVPLLNYFYPSTSIPKSFIVLPASFLALWVPLLSLLALADVFCSSVWCREISGTSFKAVVSAENGDAGRNTPV